MSMKVQWLMRSEGDAHAVRIGTGGTLQTDQGALCGVDIELPEMFHWGIGLRRPRCSRCHSIVNKRHLR